MKIELDVNEYKAVGPYPDVYGHGPVTWLGSELAVCLDCGYTTEDIRLLAHNKCDRDKNGITQTWRERFRSEKLESLPLPTDDEEWPIEDRE